jgi:NADPH:quinone reductase-like Zn-dependent oxidoreductase
VQIAKALGADVTSVCSTRNVDLVRSLGADQLTLKELIEAGTLTPVVDRAYPLSEVPKAMRYFGAGHVRGKVVITL